MRKADGPEGKTFTYQARVLVDAGAGVALDAYAELFGRVERTLFAQATAQGVKPEKLGTAPKSETPEARVKRLGKLHQKTRRMVSLAARLEGMRADHKAGTIRIAFGSRRLFRAQFDLSGNGFADHAAWRNAWHSARSAQFSVLGSKDETGGCQGCVATLAGDGTVSLRLRVPDALITADANASCKESRKACVDAMGGR